jgi:hypothetical protein
MNEREAVKEAGGSTTRAVLAPPRRLTREELQFLPAALEIVETPPSPMGRASDEGTGLFPPDATQAGGGERGGRKREQGSGLFRPDGFGRQRPAGAGTPDAPLREPSFRPLSSPVRGLLRNAFAQTHSLTRGCLDSISSRSFSPT